MWISLIIAIITYLLSPKGTDAERRTALLNAAAAGGTAYVATKYTDWGQNISDRFDGAIGIKPAPTLTPEQQTALNKELASGIKVDGTVSTPTSTWDKMQQWAPTALGLAAGASLGGVPIMPLMIGAGALILLSR